MKTLYILHGYTAAPDHHWFPWLRNELKQLGYTANSIALPDSHKPVFTEWQSSIAAQVPTLDRNTYFIAHSLGCITLLRYLASCPLHTRIGGFILVSGFSDRLPLHPELDAFVAEPPDFAKLQAISPYRSIIAAQDDMIVPFSLSQALAEQLNAKFIAMESGNHFMAGDGYTEFPALMPLLEEMLTFE